MIGSQFVVTLTNMSHLAGQLTVLGTCTDLDVVRSIATAVAHGDRGVRVVHVGVRE